MMPYCLRRERNLFGFINGGIRERYTTPDFLIASSVATKFLVSGLASSGGLLKSFAFFSASSSLPSCSSWPTCACSSSLKPSSSLLATLISRLLEPRAPFWSSSPSELYPRAFVVAAILRIEVSLLRRHEGTGIRKAEP
jgi:hypothetical protein